MRTTFIQTGLSLLLLWCSVSCTGMVWEDRGECPCRLTLDLRHIPPEIKTMHLWFFGENDRILYRDTLGPETLESAYSLLVEKGQIRYFVWANIGEATKVIDDSTLNISLLKRDGFPADSLYFYSGTVDTRSEYAGDVIMPGKEFATVHLVMKNHRGEADMLQMELLSNSSGFYVDKRFLPGQGSVNTCPYQIEQGDALFSSRISRQASLQDIRMCITYHDRGTSIPIADYPLGEWLSGNGYDMHAFNLSDITLVLDLSTNFITIRAEDWLTTFPAEINF